MPALLGKLQREAAIKKLRPKPVRTKEKPSEPLFALFGSKEMSGSHKTATVAAPEGFGAASQCSHRCKLFLLNPLHWLRLFPLKRCWLVRAYLDRLKKIIRLELFKMDPDVKWQQCKVTCRQEAQNPFFNIPQMSSAKREADYWQNNPVIIN